MAQHTANYNLEKQQGNDLVNINGINNNFDIIDTEINEAQNRMQKAVGTLSELKAVTGVPENTTILCKGLGLYRYDASSAATPDDFFIVAPSLGAGRWILMAETAMGFSADTGSTNAFVLTLPGLSAFYTGMMVWFKPVNGNTGACTINVNTLGAKSLVRPGGVALTSGDITAGALICAVYDGTNFQLISLLAANLVHLTATQTLTNKTLNSPILTTPKFATAGYITDANGNELIRFPSTVASAVNEITVNNAATGVPPSIQSSGSDTNVGLDIKSKGTGTIRNYVNNVVSVVFDAAASAVNSLTMKSNATNNSPSIEAAGSDTNVGIDVKTKGTGVFRALVNGVVAFVVDTVAGAVNYLTVKANTTGYAPAIMATGNDTNIDVNVVPKGTGRLKENGTAVIRQGDDYRPNLLVNGDFKIGSTRTSYNPADKWLGASSGTMGTVTVGSDYLTVTSASVGETYIVQYGIKSNNIVGKKCTLSFCDANDNIISVTGILSASAVAINFANGYIYFDQQADGTARVVFVAYVGKTVTAKWIKLEQNDHATPFIPKSYKEELLNISDNLGYAPNILINGDFQVWQRGTLFSNISAYTADRWIISNNTDTNTKVTKVSTGYRVEEYSSVGSTTAYSDIYQKIENYSALAGKTITFSANVTVDSGASANLTLWDGVGATSYGAFTTSGIKTVTFTVSANPTFLYAMITLYRGGLAVGKGLTINWAKLEQNEHATPFISRHIEEELQLCYRYAETCNPWITSVSPVNTTLAGFRFRVKKRISSPTITITNTPGTGVGKVTEWASGTDIAVSSVVAYEDGAIYISAPGAVAGKYYNYYYFVDAEM